jgi:hypothetical protein
MKTNYFGIQSTQYDALHVTLLDTLLKNNLSKRQQLIFVKASLFFIYFFLYTLYAQKKQNVCKNEDNIKK